MAARFKKLLRQRDSFDLNVLQWNAGGLSGAKFAELKKIVVERDVDVLVVQEANITEQNIKYYDITNYEIFGLYKKRQIASGILVAIKQDLISVFKIVKEMNDQDFAEIVAITLWKKNVQFRIHGVYSPPNNKHLNLDTLLLLRNSIIMGDFNAASPSWGYGYYNRVGEIVEDYADSNGLTILYNERDPKTFIHYSGSSTNPDLAMISPSLIDGCKKFVLGDPGSGHRMTLVTYTSEGSTYYSRPRPMWNFKKANWPGYSADLENLVINIPQDTSPHGLYSSFTEALLKSAKMNIPRGRSFKFKPFWNEELSTQRKKREASRLEAESTEGKSPEEQRHAVIVWRKECALMKRKVIEAK